MLADTAGIISTIIKKAGANTHALDAALEHEINNFPRVQWNSADLSFAAVTTNAKQCDEICREFKR